jgi:hypothetical protein
VNVYLEAAKQWLAGLMASPDPTREFESLVPDPLTADIARALHQIATSQLAAGEWESGSNVANLAVFAYTRLDMDADALGARLDGLQGELARAEGPEPHRSLREEFERCALTARQVARDDLALRAHAGAGDCAYFAAEATADPHDRATLLRIALGHATWALQTGPDDPEPPHLARCVSLLVGTLDELRGPRSDSPDHDELQAARRRAAAAIERALPAERTLPWNPGLEWTVHARLAQLLYEHGSGAAAEVHAERALTSAPDSAAWITTASDLYSAAKEGIDPHVRLEPLRRRMRERSDEYREGFRSEAGRLFAGLELDHWLGEGLRDDMMLAAWSDSQLSQEALAALAEDGERLKARLLLDRMSRTLHANLPTVELASRAHALESEVMRLEAAPLDGQRGEEMRLASLLAPIDSGDRVARLTEVEELLRAHDAGLVGAAAVARVADLADALEPGEVLLDFFNPYDIYEPSSQAFCALLSASGIEWARIPPLLPTEDFEFIGRISVGGEAPLDASPLGWQIVLLRTAIRDREDEAAESILETLWRLLVEPVIAAGHDPAAASRWVVAPQGVLHLIPWAALRSPEGDFLGDVVPLSVVPSAAVWHHLATRPRPDVRRALVLGNPAIELPGYDALPEAEAEAGEVGELLAPLPVNVYTGAEASEQALRKQAPGAGIVHLATHCDFPEETAFDFHRLLLARTAAEDGSLHADELRSIDLSAARLVTLSVCNGATIRFGPGDEPYGLLPAFLTAGAENVLGTLWPIDDSAGRAFAREFYTRLLQAGPGAALTGAMRARREAGAPVRDWATYTLTGTGRPFTGTAK